MNDSKKPVTLLLAFFLTLAPLSAQESTTSAETETPEGVPEKIEWSFWFPGGVKNVNGESVELSDLEGKMVGIYFSAHWCPPCRQFTPALVDFYEKNKENLEIVFVSGDRSPAEKARYIKEDKMTWLTLDYRSEASDHLLGGLGIKSFPTLVILNDAGKIITMEGYPQLAQAPDQVWEMWSAYMTQNS